MVDPETLSNRDILLLVLEEIRDIHGKLDGKVGRTELFGWLTLSGGLLAIFLN